MARRDHPAPTPRVRVKRLPERAKYEREAIEAVLDAALVAHLGFVSDGQPYVIPTLQARVDDLVYVHGSAASRTLRALSRGIPACLTVSSLLMISPALQPKPGGRQCWRCRPWCKGLLVFLRKQCIANM